MDKDELFHAGLGKKIIFSSLDIDAAAFWELLLETFPKLKDGGGYHFLKRLVIYKFCLCLYIPYAQLAKTASREF